METADTGPSNSDHVVNFEYYCVSLVDVLNQKEHLARWSKIPGPSEDKASFLAALKKSVGTIHAMRDMMLKYVRAFSATGLSSAQLAALSPPQLEQYKAWSRSHLQLQCFSDTSVLYAPLKAHDGDLLLRDMFGIMGGTAMLMPAVMAVGVVLRGAIEVGAGTDAFPGQLYGNGLAKAYHLENEIAQYPRVVVGPQLVDLLRQYSQREVKSQVGQLARDMSSEMLNNLILTDDDGVAILDYLGPFVRQQAASLAPEFIGLIHKAAAFVREQHDLFRKQGNIKLAARYARLRRYFDARLPEWR